MGILMGRFQSSSLIVWHVPWIVLVRNYLMVRACDFVLLFVGCSRTRGKGWLLEDTWKGLVAVMFRSDRCVDCLL